MSGMYNRTVRLLSPAEMQPIDYAGPDCFKFISIAIRSKSALTFALEKIKKSEAELRQIDDVILQAIVVLTPDGKANYANRATIEYTGYCLLTKHEPIIFCRRAFHPGYIPKDLWNNGAEVFSTPVPFENEYRTLGKRRQLPLVSDPL